MEYEVSFREVDYGIVLVLVREGELVSGSVEHRLSGYLGQQGEECIPVGFPVIGNRTVVGYVIYPVCRARDICRAGRQVHRDLCRCGLSVHIACI